MFYLEVAQKLRIHIFKHYSGTKIISVYLAVSQNFDFSKRNKTTLFLFYRDILKKVKFLHPFQHNNILWI